MSNSIDAAIAQASNAAASVPAEANTAVAPAQQQNTAVAAPQPGRPMGLDDAMAGTQVVDEYLKVSEHGLTIGNSKPILEEIKVRMDLSEVQYTEAVKYGNPATYEKTTDRVLTTTGKPWAQALVDAQKVQPNARPYKSADLTMELVEEIELKDKTVEAGTQIGHSLSTTGFKSFAKLVKALRKLDIDPSSDTIEVTVGYLEQSGNGNNWGILDFRNPVRVE